MLLRPNPRIQVMRSRGFLGAAAIVMALLTPGAGALSAGDLMAEWANVKAPPPPEFRA